MGVITGGEEEGVGEETGAEGQGAKGVRRVGVWGVQLPPKTF